MTFSKGRVLMGLMWPWMIHSSQSLGLAFVSAHVAVIGGAAVIATFGASRFQSMARVLAHHRPRAGHLVPAAIGLVAGFALTGLSDAALLRRGGGI